MINFHVLIISMHSPQSQFHSSFYEIKSWVHMSKIFTVLSKHLLKKLQEGFWRLMMKSKCCAPLLISFPSLYLVFFPHPSHSSLHLSPVLNLFSLHAFLHILILSHFSSLALPLPCSFSFIYLLLLLSNQNIT